MDLYAIATAAAARYAAGTLVPPAGYPAIRTATAKLPNELGGFLPALLVFPPTGRLRAGNGTRLGSHDWIARFYYDQAGVDQLERDSVALMSWTSVLVDAHRGSVMLGGLVVSIRTVGYTIGLLRYAGSEYSGVQLALELETAEGWSVTA